MSLRLDPTDSSDVTADQRLDEIASILARGVVRLHRRYGIIASPQNLEESLATRLELVAPFPLDGVAG
ncbi:MAG TPA: hypothetical protein VFF69_15970 [Phycisphaerales bacterium]|nr:hypothetical protein [Phycisphaerales bacterium]